MMNIRECKRCRHHIAEFYGSALCRLNSYPKLYIWIEIDDKKNVACPKEHDGRHYTEENAVGFEC